MCGHFHADHLCEQHPMMRIKNVSKKSGLQAKMIIHLKKKTWQVETFWNSFFFIYVGFKPFRFWNGELKQLHLLLGQIPYIKESSHVDGKKLFQRIWQPKFAFLQGGWASPIEQNMMLLRSLVNLDHLLIRYISGGLNLWNNLCHPQKKARHNYKNVDEGAVVLTHWVASCRKASRRFSRFVENQVDHCWFREILVNAHTHKVESPPSNPGPTVYKKNPAASRIFEFAFSFAWGGCLSRKHLPKKLVIIEINHWNVYGILEYSESHINIYPTSEIVI